MTRSTWRIEHQLCIAAPAALVWEVTTDIAKWSEWPPTVTSVRLASDAPLEIGSRFELKQPLQRPAIWEVTDLVPGERFVWERRNGGVGCGLNTQSPRPRAARSAFLRSSSPAAPASFLVFLCALRWLWRTAP
jgi:hypothetical protein